jgi:hypothetical protein
MRWASVRGVMMKAFTYLLGGQPAHVTQGERNARFRRQEWMTARKINA